MVWRSVPVLSAGRPEMSSDASILSGEETKTGVGAWFSIKVPRARNGRRRLTDEVVRRVQRPQLIGQSLGVFKQDFFIV